MKQSGQSCSHPLNSTTCFRRKVRTLLARIGDLGLGHLPWLVRGQEIHTTPSTHWKYYWRVFVFTIFFFFQQKKLTRNDSPRRANASLAHLFFVQTLQTGSTAAYLFLLLRRNFFFFFFISQRNSLGFCQWQAFRRSEGLWSWICSSRVSVSNDHSNQALSPAPAHCKLNAVSHCCPKHLFHSWDSLRRASQSS